jgi:hypothetical protein
MITPESPRDIVRWDEPITETDRIYLEFPFRFHDMASRRIDGCHHGILDLVLSGHRHDRAAIKDWHTGLGQGPPVLHALFHKFSGGDRHAHSCSEVRPPPEIGLFDEGDHIDASADQFRCNLHVQRAIAGQKHPLTG